MTPFQERCLNALRATPNGTATTAALAGEMKTAQYAVQAAMVHLANKGWVVRQTPMYWALARSDQTT